MRGLLYNKRSGNFFLTMTQNPKTKRGRTKKRQTKKALIKLIM
jgi:hypothetical protein